MTAKTQKKYHCLACAKRGRVLAFDSMGELAAHNVHAHGIRYGDLAKKWKRAYRREAEAEREKFMRIFR